MADQLDQLTHERQARLTANEAAFRAANEQIDALNAAGARAPHFPIVCECGSASCLDVLTVEAEHYTAVRADPHRFLVKLGHEAPDVESVVERRDGYVVVEKDPGLPQEIAEATDPRSSGHLTISDPSARRIAENEARFRDANEHIEEAVLRLEANAYTLPFVCECGRVECLKTMRLTVSEYELARQDSRYFVCIPGHQIVAPDLGRVVQEYPKFVIVEKLAEAGKVAEELDPRA